uniref:NDUF8 factor n=1 Tax=Accipiter nisus TaxID=211598 RepID=A0A8B9NEB7_9AVES
PLPPPARPGPARTRLRKLNRSLSGAAAAYGRCVAAAAGGTAELRRDVCLEEFRALRDCFARAVGFGPGPGPGLGPGGRRCLSPA